MLSLITYADKVALNENTEVAEINKVTAGNMNEIKNVINAIADTIYPVGITVMFYDNDDHSDFCGGTWVRTSVGKMPVGYNSSDTDFNTIGKTGGEKTHTLTIDELAKHKHNLLVATLSRSSGSGYYTLLKEEGWAIEPTHSINGAETSIVGGDQPHNNMPPYEVFAFWRRTA